MNTSIWISIGQTALYGAIAAFLPALISTITSGGIVIPYGLTAFVLLFLNQLENVIQARDNKPLFGLVG